MHYILYLKSCPSNFTLQKVDCQAVLQSSHGPIYKKEARTNLKNYWPVSVLSAISKIYETFIHESFAPFVDAFCQLSCKHKEKDKSMKTQSLMFSWKIYEFF